MNSRKHCIVWDSHCLCLHPANTLRSLLIGYRYQARHHDTEKDKTKRIWSMSKCTDKENTLRAFEKHHEGSSREQHWGVATMLATMDGHIALRPPQEHTQDERNHLQMVMFMEK